MRKVSLRMNENEKYQIIKKLVDTEGNKHAASLKLGCSKRHINRLIIGYRTEGKNFFAHGNRGRKPSITVAAETKQLILDFYRTKYSNANLTHYHELLKEGENINVSVSTISSILRNEYIISPKAHRATRKNVKQELKALKSKTTSKKKQASIQSSILDLESSHPRHPRCTYFGEMIQMDASEYIWFGDVKAHLHIAVDDATGTLVGAWFDAQETLNGYYNVLSQILTQYGIPYQFFTDNRTVFEYKLKKDNNVEKDTHTQFGYACKQLGIDIRTSSVPQSKGRVERMNGTLQSRLPIELRLNCISTIEDANKFLNSYIKKFNKRFALPLNNIKSVFETQPTFEKINLTLAVLSSRKIDNGSCLKYNNNYYLTTDKNGCAVHFRKGTSVLVIKAFDGNLYCCVGEEVYSLEILLNHKLSSHAFDLAMLPTQPKKKYIPPMSHPWKKLAFDKYLEKQPHRNDVA